MVTSLRRRAACFAIVAALAGCGDSSTSPTGGAGGGGSAAGGAGGAASEGGTAQGGAADGGSGHGGAAQGGAPANGSSGCGSATDYALGSTTVDDLEHGGLTRSFRVHLPPGYDPNVPLPVVVMLHGGAGSGEQLETASSGMSEIADAEGFIAVYPDGTGAIKTWNAGTCCGSAVSSNVDDVGFIGALLDDVEASLCVDLRRVYAAGMSNGAMMTHRLACELPQHFAAFGPVAGADLLPACTPSEPVAMMHIHGTDDGHVPVDGGLGCGPSNVPFPPLAQTMETRRLVNGCEATTTVAFTEGDGTCRAYDQCDADVLLCMIEGGGHSWPGGEPNVDIIDCPADGEQSTTFHASQQLWTFFSAHERPPR